VCLRYFSCRKGSFKAGILRSKGGWAEGAENYLFWRLTPELIVVSAAASLPTAVTTLTEVGLVVHSWAQLSKLGARRHLEPTNYSPRHCPPPLLHAHTQSYPVSQGQLGKMARMRDAERGIQIYLGQSIWKRTWNSKKSV
jgi:hypothetical protein